MLCPGRSNNAGLGICRGCNIKMNGLLQVPVLLKTFSAPLFFPNQKKDAYDGNGKNQISHIMQVSNCFT